MKFLLKEELVNAGSRLLFAPKHKPDRIKRGNKKLRLDKADQQITSKRAPRMFPAVRSNLELQRYLKPFTIKLSTTNITSSFNLNI